MWFYDDRKCKYADPALDTVLAAMVVAILCGMAGIAGVLLWYW